MANAKGTIRWKACTDILFSQTKETTDLMILSLGCQQKILGMPWLRKWNPRINWTKNIVSIPKTPSPPFPDHIPQQYLLQWLGLDADRKISKRLNKRQAWLNGEQIHKTTISTQIAQATGSVEPTIPDWCKDFVDVFSEKTHNQLPPHHPYDHTIELRPDFVPKIAKIYSLNPTEMETCKSFVDEHLKTGRIVPLKSPQASPFFFVPKKDGTLRPCQDYHYLNSHTIRNAYPLPLIPELIDDMKDAIKEWKPPTSVKGIRSFTGFANFYRKFIPDFSNVVAPLNLLTQKGEPWVWTQLQQWAFECLKHIFSSAPILRIPDVTCPFSVMTNASLLAAGAVLMQKDKNSDLHPCAYFS